MGVEETRARRAARVASGARVGEYVLERALGSGAMGSVYVGRHVGSGARHALKVLHLGAGSERRERFAREARALAKVDRHPGVIRIHRYDVEPDGLAYCALELVEGGDLEALLEAHPAGLPLARALAIGEGLARALAHVHAAGVVHRDLKPANVLLPGGRDAPMLTDFGVARDEAEERLTRSRQLVGTPHYMAPEQVVGDQGRVGPATDVFALGVVLYRALTGALPFDGDSLLELTRRVCEEEPSLPRARRPELPRDLDAVVLRALEKDPARRPSAAEVAGWLASLARGEALGLRGSGAVDRVVRRLRRGRAALALAAAGVLVVAALAVVARWGLADPAEDLARTLAALEVQAEVARLDAGRVERLLTGAPPDPEPLAAARARLAAAPGRVDAESLAAADAALAAAAAEEALTRGDPDALARLVPGAARALLEARARGDDPAPADGRLGEALRALAVDAALARGDAALARERLALVRDPALAGARRVLELRLDLVEAEAAAARLAAAEVRAALEAAAARDPAAAAAAAPRVIARALARDAAGAVEVVRAVRQALPGAPLPGAGRALHAAATAARADGRQAEVALLVDEAWRLDPATPPPLEIVGALLVEGAHLLDTERALEGLPLVLHAVRAGRAYPLPMRRVVRLFDRGVLDAWLAQHPTDWAGRFLRAGALLDKLEGLPAHVRDDRCRRALEDLDALEPASPPLPDSVRASLDVLRADALSQQPGHLARIEAVLTLTHPLRWKLCHRAAQHCEARRDAAGQVLWSRRWVDAVLERAGQMERGELDADAHEFFDPSHQLKAAYSRLSNGLIGAGRLDEARTLLDEVTEVSLLTPLHRAEVLAPLSFGLGRWADAAAAARVVLAHEPTSARMKVLLADAEARLSEAR